LVAVIRSARKNQANRKKRRNTQRGKETKFGDLKKPTEPWVRKRVSAPNRKKDNWEKGCCTMNREKPHLVLCDPREKNIKGKRREMSD